MIKKSVKIIDVLENSVIYEVTTVTEQTVTFAESIAAVMEKYADSAGNSRMQSSAIKSALIELTDLDANTDIHQEAKGRVISKLSGMKQALESSIENLDQDVAVYKEVLDAYNKKHNK